MLVTRRSIEKSLLKIKEILQESFTSHEKIDEKILVGVESIKFQDVERHQFLQDLQSNFDKNLFDLSVSNAEIKEILQSIEKASANDVILKENVLASVNSIKESNAKAFEFLNNLNNFLSVKLEDIKASTDNLINIDGSIKEISGETRDNIKELQLSFGDKFSELSNLYAKINENFQFIKDEVEKDKSFKEKVLADVNSLGDNSEEINKLLENMHKYIDKRLMVVANLKDELIQPIMASAQEASVNTISLIQTIEKLFKNNMNKIFDLHSKTNDGLMIFDKSVQDYKEDIINVINTLKEDNKSRLAKPTEQTQPISVSESAYNFEKIIELYHKYDQKLQYIQKEGSEKDRQKLKDAQKKFSIWKSYLIKISDTLTDELSYEFNEILESFDISKDKRLLTFPVDLVDQEKTLGELNIFFKELQTIPEGELKDKIMAASKANVRTTTELDYRIEDSGMPQKVRTIKKDALNTLLIFSKQLDNKVKTEIMNLQNWVLQIEQNVQLTPQEFDAKDLLEKLFNFDLPKDIKNEEINKILGKADGYLQDNFQNSSRAFELADKFEKKYFLFLKNNLFKIANDLKVSEKFYTDKITAYYKDSPDQLEDWTTIYKQLVELFLNYFNKYLDIKVVDCNRGDDYNPDLHTPYMEAEPDKELTDNKIKSIVHQGFQFNDSTNTIVIKPADVIVVKN